MIVIDCRLEFARMTSLVFFTKACLKKKGWAASSPKLVIGLSPDGILNRSISNITWLWRDTQFEKNECNDHISAPIKPEGGNQMSIQNVFDGECVKGMCQRE